MSVFLCAVATDGRTPAAYALVEQSENGDGRRYRLRDLGRFENGEAMPALQNRLAADPEMVGRVIVITTGGQPAADRLHDGGLSAVAVETQPAASRDADALSVAEQQLVDTFATLYRRGVVEVSVQVDGASEALAALYIGMSDDAGAEEASEEMEALAESELTGEDVTPIPEDGPKPAVVEQSGSEEHVSTVQIGSTTGGHRSTKDSAFFVPEEFGPQRQGRTDDRVQAFERLELGEAREPALALALALWYGEFSTTDLPVTDQADETARARQVRAARQAAARARAGSR